MLQYKHIIWDWNGTLLNDVDQCIRVLNDLLKRRQLATITTSNYRETFDFPVIDFYRKLGFDFSTESYESVANEYICGYRDIVYQCSLRVGAIETLQTFFDLKITQSVLSAYQQQLLEEAVANYQLDRFFIGLTGLDDFSAQSKVENGKRWIARLPHETHEVLLIGDTLHDVEVAYEMGIHCVLLDDGHQSRSRLESTGVPIFNNLHHLVESIVR